MWPLEKWLAFGGHLSRARAAFVSPDVCCTAGARTKVRKVVRLAYAVETPVWLSCESWAAHHRAEIQAAAGDDRGLPGFLQIEREGQCAARLNSYSQ